MKRTALKRSTGLSRGKPMARKSKTKQAAREGDEAYLQFVRSLPCCVCGHDTEPSHPHHMVGHLKGLGMKAPDRETMPLCFAHHRAFHDGVGHFAYWSREGRILWQETEIALVQTRWRLSEAS